MTVETVAQQHRIMWWVYAGRERIRHTDTMRGRWGWDATCTCGWDTKTGGAVRSYIAREVMWHKVTNGVPSRHFRPRKAVV